MIRKFWIFSFLFFTTTLVFATDNITEICKSHACKIIVDAGSSGSRLHVYSYDLADTSELVNIREISVNKLKPGLSSLEPDQVADYLEKLTQNIPEIDFKVYFYATAGMRLLSLDKQDELYSSVRKWFDKHDKWHLIETRTISGAEEGVFGWLAMYKALGDSQQILPGFIEIGGASLQVVFPIRDYSSINSEDITTFKIDGQEISLFSHSYLGLGANEITRKFHNSSSCFPIGYTLANGYVANGDADFCSQEIIESLDESGSVSDIIKLPLQTNMASTWYTVGAISSISHKIPLNINEDEFSVADLFEKINNIYCKQSWDLQKKNFSDDYLNQNCLIGAFFYGITTAIYGIDPNQKFKTFASGADPDWTIGALYKNID